jgi:hypothetical protein
MPKAIAAPKAARRSRRWRKPGLSVNLGVRCALQMPFSAQNSSYSTATLDSLWGISGYVPVAIEQPDPRLLPPVHAGHDDGKKPNINLGKGVQAYDMDANNIAQHRVNGP